MHGVFTRRRCKKKKPRYADQAVPILLHLALNVANGDQRFAAA
jgi:hypothetical protein